jgi:hypothetical protein
MNLSAKRARFFFSRFRHYYRQEIAAGEKWPDSKPFASLKEWFLLNTKDDGGGE